MKDKCQGLRELEIGYLERWLGLKGLEVMTLTFKEDESDSLADEAAEGEARGPLAISAVLLDHDLLSLQDLDIPWEGRTNYVSGSFSSIMA